MMTINDDELDFGDPIPDPPPVELPAVSADAEVLLQALHDGHGDGYWRSPRWLSRQDLIDRSGLPIDRVKGAIAELLRAKRIDAPISRVYAFRAHSIEWGAQLPLRFKPRQLGEIWCDSRNIPHTMIVAHARFMCGLGPEVVDYNHLAVPDPYIGHRPSGCIFEATPQWVFELRGPFTATIAQAIRHDISAGVAAATLQERARFLGLRARLSASKEMDLAIYEFRARNLEPYALFAEAALATLVGDRTPSFIAPSDFDVAVAEADVSSASVDQWWILESKQGRGELSLAARHLDHPTLGQGERLDHSSPLVWIDEEKGWARTVSRFYRLGGRLK